LGRAREEKIDSSGGRPQRLRLTVPTVSSSQSVHPSACKDTQVHCAIAPAGVFSHTCCTVVFCAEKVHAAAEITHQYEDIEVKREKRNTRRKRKRNEPQKTKTWLGEWKTLVWMNLQFGTAETTKAPGSLSKSDARYEKFRTEMTFKGAKALKRLYI
jgi:hypothetical protein